MDIPVGCVNVNVNVRSQSNELYFHYLLFLVSSLLLSGETKLKSLDVISLSYFGDYILGS